MIFANFEILPTTHFRLSIEVDNKYTDIILGGIYSTMCVRMFSVMGCHLG